MSSLTESVVEEAALAWIESLGWAVAHGPDIAPDTPGAERAEYGQVVLEGRLRDALARLNSDLPVEALDDAFRKLTRSEGPELTARNRAFHRLVVDGVTVEYRTADGRIRGAQAEVIDFADPSNNDWLAVNQFTVTEWTSPGCVDTKPAGANLDEYRREPTSTPWGEYADVEFRMIQVGGRYGFGL